MEISSGVKDVIMHHLVLLLDTRDWPKTICPSEVPRAMTTAELSSAGASNFRDLMPHVRQIVWEMRDRGEVEILQKGSKVSDNVALEDIKGPIRVRRSR